MQKKKKKLETLWPRFARSGDFERVRAENFMQPATRETTLNYFQAYGIYFTPASARFAGV